MGCDAEMGCVVGCPLECAGGVEYAFMSTTPDKNVAWQYSADGYGIVVEIQQGMIDRGADISWLSQ